MYFFFTLIFFFLVTSFLIKSVMSVFSKEAYLLVISLVFSLAISLIFFYFFETPFLIETAFAEEVNNNLTEETSPQTETKKTEDTSYLTKVKNFCWDYKWALLAGISFLIFVGFVVYTGDSTAAQMQIVATDPKLPTITQDVHYLQDFPKGTFTQSITHSTNMPKAFIAGYEVDLNGNTTAVCTNVPNVTKTDYAGPVYRVYPNKPILHADIVNTIFNDQTITTAGNNIVPYNVAATANIPNVINTGSIYDNNPYGYSETASTKFWIDQSLKLFPKIIEHFKMHNDPHIILCYQEVALVEPDTLYYTIYHNVTIRSVNVQALATPFATDFKAGPGVLYSVYMKDNSIGWIQ